MTISTMQQLEAFRSSQKPILTPSDTIEILVGMGTCDIAAGSKETLETIKQIVKQKKLKNVQVASVGCIGFCSEEPTVEIHMPNREPIVYRKITEDKVAELIQTVVIDNGYLDDSRRIPSFHHSGVYLQNKRTLLVSVGNDHSVGNDVIVALKERLAPPT